MATTTLVRVNRGRGGRVCFTTGKTGVSLDIGHVLDGVSGAALAGAGLGRNTPKPGEKNDKKWLPLSDGYRFFFYLFDLSCLVYGWFTKVVTMLKILRSIRLCFLIKFGNINLKLVLFLYQSK